MHTRVLALSVALLSAGCGPVPPLFDAYGSSEALAAAVLEALARRDRARLESLALREQEFRDHVWPDLPAARPERNLPFSYVWGDLHQKSQTGLAATLQKHGGERYRLERISFARETSYPHYRVHRETAFHVRNTAGLVRAIRICGSMIEKDGVWKVFSYVVDD